MLNFKNCKKIFVCANNTKFAGGINAFQIRIYAHFNDEEIINSLFVFCSKNKRQLKLYLETSTHISLTQYRIKKGEFNYPLIDGNYYKIDKRQLEWIINGLNQIKEEQKYKINE